MGRVGTIALLLLLSATLVPACGPSGQGPADTVDPGELPATDADDAGPDTPREPTVVTEPFRAIFTYLKRVDPPGTDLFSRDPTRSAADGTDSLSDALALAAPGLDCGQGCRVDPTGRWLAVFAGAPSSATGGSLVRLFRLSAGPTVEASGLPDVTDVRALAFGKDALYWSRPRPACEAERGPSKGCHAFYRRALPGPDADEFLFSFPTAATLGTALPHPGTFRLGEDGRTVLLLAPTVNTQGVWIWRAPGEPIQVVGPLCGTRQQGGDGACIGSGVAYSDRDPVALSSDGNHLVLATVLEDRDLVLAHLDLSDRTLRTAILLGIPQDVTGFAQNACYNRESWQPTSVLAPLRFSPDGKDLLFIGMADCGSGPGVAKKPWTNVLAVPLARIDQGGRLARGDLLRVTDFPAEYSARCVTLSPDALDLSPTGDYVVFVGTARYDSSGAEIEASQLAHVQDTEVWVARRDGTTEPAQLTGDLDRRATSVAAVPAPGP